MCPDCNRRFYWDKEAEAAARDRAPRDRGGREKREKGGDRGGRGREKGGRGKERGGGRGAGGRGQNEYHCKSCNNPLTYVRMYEKWYCEYCRRYL